MPRFIEQDLFDVMAITQTMLRLKATATPENAAAFNKEFSDAIEDYKRDYPDEDWRARFLLTCLQHHMR